MIQVTDSHYNSRDYDELHRWISYWYQIQSIIRYKPESVLELGIGTGEVSQYLKRRLKIDTVTFDFSEELNPDVVGDIRNLRTYFDSNSVDIICAFQILEHIPFEYFEDCLQQMNDIARNNVIISLPHWGYYLQVRLRFWRYKWGFAFGRKLTRSKTWQFNGEHYWEIGTNETPLYSVRDTVSRVLDIEKEYFCPDYPYHYFFETRVKN